MKDSKINIDNDNKDASPKPKDTINAVALGVESLKYTETSVSETLTSNINAGTISSSNIYPKWLAWVIEQAAPFKYTSAFFLALMKLGFAIYQYVKAPNKNINEKTALGWTILNTALIGTAVIGGLVAAPIFLPITVALITGAALADTLRNLGFMLWNIGMLAALRFSVRNKLNNPIVKAQYEKYKLKYVAKIKEYALGFVLSSLMTAVLCVVLLTPKIGLGAISATVLVIGGVKTTAAGLAGFVGNITLLVPLATLGYQLGKRLTAKIVNGVRNLFNKSFFNSKVKTEQKNRPEVRSEQQQVAKPDIKAVKIDKDQVKGIENHKQANTETSTAKCNNILNTQNAVIKNKDELDLALKEELKFNAFFKTSRSREVFIMFIDENKPELANALLMERVKEKIAELDTAIKLNSGFLANKEKHKREQKREALQLILNHLEDKNKDTYTDINDLLVKIKDNYPAVKDSFWRDVSDTQTIINDLDVYNKRFHHRYQSNDEPKTVCQVNVLKAV